VADRSEYPQFIFNPDADVRKLAWENHVVLVAVQASLGNVGPDVRGIAVEAGADRVTFHVALGQRSPRSDEDIDDMLVEFDAGTAGCVQGDFTLGTVVTVGDAGPGWSGYPWRRIFLAHG
jgi:hypothetical protein